MRVFPLRANLSRLETFCDNYLNIAPAEMARFHPITPYVYLMVINYGRMAGDASNMGWVAQNEILFSVPVQGRWHEDGEVVEDFATVSPYIWVDNPWSITTGREVFGWPKMMAWHNAGANEWMRDPSARRGLLEMKTLLFSKDYAGELIQPRLLLRIEQDTPKFLSQFPADPSHLAAPFIQQLKTGFHLANSAPDVIRGLSQLTKSGGMATVRRQFGNFFENLGGASANFYGNTINLKQFRATTSTAACYQAITNSKMVFRRYLKGGMLGSFDLLLGDPTAGFTIQIHRYPAYPLVEALGLEVDNEVEHGSTRVAEIKPLFPFWMKVDMRYELGERLCWRTQETEWFVGDKRDETPLVKMHSPKVATSTPYNTTLGPIIGAMEGPFDFYDATVRVLPLRAKSSVLNQLLPKVDKTLKQLWDNPKVGEGSTWEPYRTPSAADEFDSWVFLMVFNFGSMAAAANDIGWWARSEVSVAFLTRVGLTLEGRAASGENDLFFLYWPFVFVDSPLAVTEGREVTGLPSAFAEITPGEDPWLMAQSSAVARKVLRVATLDYPALGVGQEGEERLLMEILRRAGDAEEPSFVEEFVKSDAYPALQKGFRFSNLSLKQFRDEEQPELVCYRSLQAFTRAMGHWVSGNDDRKGIELEPLAGTYEVDFHPSPSFELVDALGLEVDRWDARPGTSVVATCKAQSPFWLKMDLRAALPTVLAEQSVDGFWRTGPRAGAFLDWMLDPTKAGGETFFPTRGGLPAEPAPQVDSEPDRHDAVPTDVDTSSMKSLRSLVRDLEALARK